MKVCDVLQCGFSSWYPQFKDITIKSYVIQLPQEFIDYLHADGVVLPEETVTAGAVDEDNIVGEELDVDWDTDEKESEVPNFPEFETAIKSVIKKHGGAVFPKLNWSAPRDATWISFDRTLKCTCPSDIYLLLKSSDFISHDLNQPFSYCEDCGEVGNTKIKYELVLRKWQNLQPSMEFRCFVKNSKLIGISQRDHTNYYEYIKSYSKDILADIKSFFYHMIAGKFNAQNYVFDVYRRDQGKLLLIDFNPFGKVTDSLLFNWDELLGNKSEEQSDKTEETVPLQTEAATTLTPESQNEPEFRFLKSREGVQPSPYLSYGVPVDIKDLASGQDPYKFMDLLSLKVQKQNEEDVSSDEEEQDANGS